MGYQPPGVTVGKTAPPVRISFLYFLFWRQLQLPLSSPTASSFPASSAALEGGVGCLRFSPFFPARARC